ncbi:MFS transporter [Amycolatopsis sp. NPDC059027]|uniref:MFS transporter n=1 Tax=unclassified Amycolatopsis TaxID=2618356 RepID=UPI00366EED7C
MVEPTQPAPKAAAGAWAGLGVLVLTGVIVSMDMSVLFFALPFLSADLRPSATETLWILDIYGFLLAGLLITMGTLGDRIGRRKLLMIGAALFGAASVVAAYSANPEMLIAARALLGIGGSTLAPSTLSLIRNMFHDAGQRRTAIGIWTAGFAGGSALGPIVGGLLLEHFWWGSVFLINVPVMVALLVLAPRLVPEFKAPASGRFDLLSAVLSFGTVLPVIYGIKKIAADGVGPVPVAAVVVGVVVGVFFLRRQRRPHPLIDVRLFAERGFSASVTANALTTFAMMGVLLFVAQYLQVVLGMRPLVAALWSLPGFLGMPIGITVATTAVRRFRPGYVVSAGLAIAAAGMLILNWLEIGSGLAVIIPAIFVIAVGIGIVSALANDLIIATAPPERAGAASAISETGTEFGGALGMAVLGSVGWGVYGAKLLELAPPGLSPQDLHAAKDTLGAAAEIAGRLSDPLGPALTGAANEAYLDGLRVAGLAGAAIMLVAAVLSAALLRRIRSDAALQATRDT